MVILKGVGIAMLVQGEVLEAEDIRNEDSADGGIGGNF